MSGSNDCQDAHEPHAGPASMAGLVSQVKLNMLPTEDFRDTIHKAVGKRQTAIHDLHEEIARLRYLLNLVAPVNSLPPELLSMVFALSEPDLVVVTHVCRRWRDIALQAPALWTHVVHRSLGGVNTFLERSQALPLDVSLTARERPTVAAVRALAREIHRTRTLHVALPPSVGLQLVTQTIKTPCPMLEELSIKRCPSPPIRNQLPVPPAPTSGPPMDFDGVPVLRSLTLYRVPLPFLPRGPNALTNIDLTDTLLPATSVLDLLERSPSLQSLKLRGHFGWTPTPSGRTVALPHLASLEVQALHADCMRAFLQSLVLPQETNISLTTPRFLRVYPVFEEVAPAFDSGAFRFASLQGLKRLELTWVNRTLTLQAYRGTDDFFGPALRIEATVRRVGGLGERFLVNWPIEAAHLETLVICGSSGGGMDDYRVHRRHWVAMLASVPALKTLRVMSMQDETLSGLAQELAQERAQPLCAQLETLELFDVNMDAAFWGTMKEVVLARAPAAGGRLRTVELFNVDGLAWGAADMALIAEAGVGIVQDFESDQEDVADDSAVVGQSEPVGDV